MPRGTHPNSLANLKHGKKFVADELQTKIAKKGAEASHEKQRMNSCMADIARQIAVAPVPEKAKARLEKMGIADDAMTGNAMVVAGVYSKAAEGDEKAIAKWEAWTIQKKSDSVYELPARIMGKAFVDLYREIIPNKTYILEGGRGSTKSSFISEELIELIKNNPMMHAVVVRKVASTLKDSVYAQIKWAIHELGLDEEFQCKSNPLEIIYKPTGQTIYFRGCDDPLKLKSIKPVFGYIGILWVEERDQLSGPEEERNIRQSVLRGGNTAYFFASYNPPKSRENWVNKQLNEPDPNRVVHHSTYLDVPPQWLGQMFLDDAEHLKEVNPDAYEHEYMGVPNGDGGNVFDNIECRPISDEEIKHFDKIYMGVDWGWYPDPFVFVRLHYDKAREIIYFIDEITNNKTPNETNAEKIKEKGYTDAFITCDSAEQKSVADFRSCGLPAKDAIKGPGSVEYGMKWLQNRRIVIDQNRTPFIYKEFVEYEYERDKDGNVISGYPDKNNHSIDATRYALERVFNKYGSNA